MNRGLLTVEKEGCNNLDWINALTALLTLSVLFLHHGNYTRYIFPAFLWRLLHIPLVSDANGISMANMALMVPVAGFVFLAGYKLELSQSSQSWRKFWFRRLVRIYPLYFLAVLVFTWFVQPGSAFGTVLVHILGLQILFPNLFGPNFLTLYYIGLALLYYSVYRLTYGFRNNPWRYITAHGIILAASVGIYWMKPFGITVLDPVFFTYYGFFVCGIECGRYKNNIANFMGRLFFFLRLRTLPQFRNRERLARLFNHMAFASYPVYLFHRPFWKLTVTLVPEQGFLQWVLVVVIGVPVMFIIGYFIQIWYNRLIPIVESFIFKVEVTGSKN